MKHSKEGQMFTEIVLEIFKLSGLLVTEGDALTKDLGLSSARWKVLGALALSNTSMTVPQIAHSMGQSRQSVQRLTDALEKDGFIDYLNNPHHKKAKLVMLSQKGKEIYKLLDKKQIPWANSAATGISFSDMQTALSVLRKMGQRFDV
jgi:DNA-binding MarR family transcriptional regulator